MVTKGFKGLQQITGGYKGLQGSYRWLLDVSRG